MAASDSTVTPNRLARRFAPQAVPGRRAETATDMSPMSMIESIGLLNLESEWRPGVTYDSIVAELNATVRTPGIANMWSMSIRNRLDMLALGP